MKVGILFKFIDKLSYLVLILQRLRQEKKETGSLIKETRETHASASATAWVIQSYLWTNTIKNQMTMCFFLYLAVAIKLSQKKTSSTTVIQNFSHVLSEYSPVLS